MSTQYNTIQINRHPQPVPLLFFGGGDESLDDGSKYNPAVISFIRDEWIASQMQSRESEYTQYRPLRFFVGTWNVNGKWPREDIAPWLTDGAAENGGANMPDIYVVGLQEMVDLTATNVALQTQCGKKTKDWVGLIETVLNNACSNDSYDCLGSKYLVGVMITVFVKRRYRAAVSEVQDGIAAVGVMGLMGNKGAAAIRLRVFDSTFCFVCAHLAAHRNAVAQRNADFASIMDKMQFKDEESGQAAAAAAAVRAGVQGVAEAGIGTTGILDHDVVVWFGDFNYRIVESVAVGKCFELANGGDAELEILRRADQLNMERAAGRSFHGFTEGPLRFRPTYKFQAGTNMYEQRAEKKLRAPAWCDRILWRTGAGIAPSHFAQLYYGSVDSMISSDHKPVHALFECAAKTTVRERKNAVAMDIAKQLDSMENSTMPRLQLSDTGAHLSDVVYSIPSTRTLTLKNTGSVAATWRFVPKPEDKVYSKTWLQVSPAYGMLSPGATATVTLTVTVDDAVARDISLGRELAMSSFAVGGPPSASGPGGVSVSPETAGGLLEDILILRVERGRDFYVPVTAAVLPTAFGCSLAQLARRPEPMRALSLPSTVTASINAAAGAGPFAAATAPQPQPGQQPQGPKVAYDLTAGSRILTNALGADELDVADPDAVRPDGSGGTAAPLSSSDSSKKGTPVMAVPKEIWRLVDVLVTRPPGLDSRGIFTAPGEPGQVALLRECLDTGDPIPAGVEARAVAQCLLELLSSLREPLIPAGLFPGVATDARYIASNPDGYSAHILRALSPLHANVLVYIVRLGREILARAANNGVQIEDLAFSLSRAVMRKVAHDEAPAHMPAGSDAGQAAAAEAAAAAASGGDVDEVGTGSGVSLVSLYADKGTRWEPTSEEQDAMTKIMSHLLSQASLA